MGSVAAYASEVLLPHLKEERSFTFELFHRGDATRYLDLPVYPYQRLRERHRQKPFDLCFYQIEDRTESQWVRIATNLLPGITWFHDLYFTSHGPEPILNSAWQELRRRFDDPQHPWPERGGEFPQVAPIGAREATFSFLPLFSSERDSSEYHRLIEHPLSESCRENGAQFQPPEITASYLPLPVRKSAFTPRERRDEVFTIAICDGARVEHRSHKVLQALQQFASDETLPESLRIRARWLIPAEDLSRAEAMLVEFDLPQVELLPELSPRRWEELVRESDIALHLRFSVFGQLHPYLGISMAQGVPVVVTRFGGGESLPPDLVYQIEPGIAEANDLHAVFRVLAGGTKPPHEEGRIRRYSEELFHEQSIADQLHHLLLHTGRSPHFQRKVARWAAFESDASRALLQEVLDEVHLEGALESAFLSSFEEVRNELGW
ncbi:hypothetical protein MRY87_03210 [bacterium]|nr:hypothetical protein [bacterium]